MKPRSRAIMRFTLIETLSQNFGVISAACIRPTEDLGRRFALGVDTYEAVPKRALGDIPDFAANTFGLGKQCVDSGGDLIKSLVGIDLRSAIRSSN